VKVVNLTMSSVVSSGVSGHMSSSTRDVIKVFIVNKR